MVLCDMSSATSILLLCLQTSVPAKGKDIFPLYRGSFVAGRFEGAGVFQSAQFHVQGTFKSGLLHGCNVREVKARNCSQDWVVHTSGTYDMGKVSDEALVPLGGKSAWEFFKTKRCYEGTPCVEHYLSIGNRAHCRACGE